MAKKTILYLRTDITNEPLIAGGSVAHTLGVIEGFFAHNYQIICATSIMQDLLEPYSFTQFIKLAMPPWLAWMRWRLNCFLSSFFFAITLYRQLKNPEKISAIYQRYSILNGTGPILSWLLQKPLIIEYNGSEAWIDHNWLAQKPFFIVRWLTAWVEKRVIRGADYLIVVSQALKDELSRRGVVPSKILVNPNGVNSTLFDPERLIHERTAIRTQLSNDNQLIIGFIGTFGQWHGIETIESMIIYAAKHLPSIHFLLIGDGLLRQPLIESLKRRGINNTTFTGIIPQAHARNYLAACDAFLAPNKPNPDSSPFFGSPTKLFEYLSLAKPIIASNVGQLSEIVQPALRAGTLHKPIVAHVGYCLDPSKPEEFHAALQDLSLRSPEERTIMGANARKKAIEEYEWATHVQTIINFTRGKKASCS